MMFQAKSATTYNDRKIFTPEKLGMGDDRCDGNVSITIRDIEADIRASVEFIETILLKFLN